MLSATRSDDETWRAAVLRIAARYGLEKEVLTEYDQRIEEGVEESTAAWEALYEWDLLDFRRVNDQGTDRESENEDGDLPR